MLEEPRRWKLGYARVHVERARERESDSERASERERRERERERERELCRNLAAADGAPLYAKNLVLTVGPAIVAYLGIFTADYRDHVIGEWIGR